MKTWDDWSDFEVNLKACELVGLNAFARHKDKDSVICNIDGDVVDKDYCSNWSDMGPLLVDGGISINALGSHCEHDDTIMINDGAWEACAVEVTGVEYPEGKPYQIFKCKNPLRAAAIVFLMMNGVSPDGRK